MREMSRTPPVTAGGAGANLPEAAAELPYPPIIYTRVLAPSRLSWHGRAGAFAIAATCLALLYTAAWLKPSPAGFGTHQQLGLQECGFKLATGIPCPACGMTTSWAYFVRGNLLASFYLQPMGLLLAIAAAGAVWVGFYIAWTGRPVHRLLRFIPANRWLIPVLCFGLIAWGWKIVLTLTGMDGWR